MMTEATIPPDVRQSLSAALRVTKRIFDAWGLSREEAAKVLGVSLEQLERLGDKADCSSAVTSDLIERTSYLLGIEKYLEILLNDEKATITDWMARPSGAEVFEGQSPKQMLMKGRVEDFEKVRDYLGFMASTPFS